MSSPETIQQAVDEAVLLLDRDKYKALDKINEISRIFLAQGIIFELRKRYHLTYVKIGAGVGVNEKTIRYNWLSANDCPDPKNLVNLAKFYLEVKRRHDEKSTR
jgi:hypothetical protein